MKTEIICITDRSGSMYKIRTDANGGFDKFIEDQKKIPGECRVSQVMFDNEITAPYTGIPLADVPPLDLQPRGATALHDAIGRTLNTHGRRIKDEAWAELVIVVIITDGHENASVEYSQHQIKNMIKHAEGNGWKFVFLAANQDAFATGAGMGISGQHTRSFVADKVGTQSAYADTSAMVGSLRAGPVDSKAAL
jgi:hypothetical protein